MSKYEKFDEALVSAIQNGADKLDAMCKSTTIQTLAQEHRVKDRCGHFTDVFRIIDRRLQALRKAGKIEYSNSRWAIKPKITT